MPWRSCHSGCGGASGSIQSVTLGDEGDEESFANTGTDAGLKGPVPRPSLKGDRRVVVTGLFRRRAPGRKPAVGVIGEQLKLTQ
jgi:hypothetical protein